jgi:hypothetical protein
MIRGSALSVVPPSGPAPVLCSAALRAAGVVPALALSPGPASAP